MPTEEELKDYKRNFQFKLSDEEKLCLETCPGYQRAYDLAIVDTYNEKQCPERRCKVSVKIIPIHDEIQIGGKCIKK